MVTLFDRFGPLGGQKSVARDPTLDYFSHNVTTTVLESWEVFFESCEVRFTAVEGNDFFVGGTAASRFCLFILKVQLRTLANNALRRPLPTSRVKVVFIKF